MQISEAQRDQIVEHLVKVVESESAILASTAMEALGHIGLRCALPALPRDSNSGILPCYDLFVGMRTFYNSRNL